MRELGRRALVDLLGEDGAYRAVNGLELDLPDDDVYEEREPEPDPVLADFYSGNSLRALAEARDGLTAAKKRYDEAVSQARKAGWSWAEVARVLGVTKQALHSRFRGRAPD
jgi:DNA-directed RNA polymerase specialized sigma24 family protein